ncbi:MAG: tyrosine-type recombinase/integrase [Kiritimatiellae bacterium]|nr:tyrosine-type recombinase/integrase [Kiritimatiellia bacterium]
MSRHKQTVHTICIRKRRDKWQVDCRKIGGKQISYETKDQAEGAAIAAWQDYQTSKLLGFDLTPERRRLAVDAFKRLEGYPDDSLLDAVDFYKERTSPKNSKRTVDELFTEFMASHEGAGNKPVTLRDYRQRLGRFRDAFRGRLVHEISTLELERWLDKIGATSTHRRNYRRELSIFFKFAVTREYARRNVATGILKVRVKRKPPEVFTPQEVRSLMFVAKEYQLGLMLPYFAIGCFAGLKSEELRRLTWEDINFETREIYVSPEAAKTSEDRFVPMQDNLVEWLQLIPDAARKGMLDWDRTAFQAIRKNAGVLEKWKANMDIMRHSAASHLYKLTGNAAQTAAAMGHGLVVFMKHYKRAVSEADGKAYFDVRPTDSKSNIMGMNAG